MILFEVKSDGTVTSTPSEMPQGSNLADLVVVAESKYTLCTMRLIPPSGLYIPDIIFIPLQTETATLWQAYLHADASMMQGPISYQIFLTDATGHVLETPEGRMTIPPGVISDMPETVGDLEEYSIADLYALLSQIYSSNVESSTRIDVLNNRMKLSMITIQPSEWTDVDPFYAFANLFTGSLTNNTSNTAYSLLLIPMDAATRIEAQKTELSVDTAYMSSGIATVLFKREDHVPTIPLKFVGVSFMTENPTAQSGGEFSTSASFVGVAELSDSFMDREVLSSIDRNLTAIAGKVLGQMPVYNGEVADV